MKSMPSAIADKITNEHQARELAKIEPERRAEVLEKVVTDGADVFAGSYANASGGSSGTSS